MSYSASSIGDFDPYNDPFQRWWRFGVHNIVLRQMRRGQLHLGITVIFDRSLRVCKVL